MEKVKPRSGFLSKIIKVSLIIWLLCIFLFFITLALGTAGFRGTVQDTSFGNSDFFIYLFLGTFIAGVSAFGFMILGFIAGELLKKKILTINKKFKSIFLFLTKLFLIVLILPLFMIYRVSGIGNLINKIKREGFRLSFFKPQKLRPLLSRLIEIIFIGLVFLPIWVGSYFLAGTLIAQQLGYISEPIPISGTGSMYPTFPKGQGKDPKELSKQVLSSQGMLPYPNGLVLFGKRLFGHQIGQGDIVVVEDDKTRELTQKIYGSPSGWVKRVIGIAGDNIELRNGIVYLNSKPLAEPYTAKPHSTFGEAFLRECQKVTVPKNSIFVMGDNRKGSGDSREVGFFSINNVKNVLPLKSQKEDLTKNWRDTSRDLEESSKIKLDKEKYLELLNEKRKEAGIKPLKYQPKLELSAFKRGEVILKYDDFSYDATRSGYTQLKAMNDAGYSNIAYGEAPTSGYYEAEELIENQFEFPETKKFLLNKDYQDVGISEVEGMLEGCPAQVIVQHFAGYVPPNYKKEDIEGWRGILNRLREIQPNWAELKTYTVYYSKYPTEINRINEIIAIRISNIAGIVAKMEANQWLSQSQTDYTYKDTDLYNEQEKLANFLNSHN